MSLWTVVLTCPFSALTPLNTTSHWNVTGWSFRRTERSPSHAIRSTLRWDPHCPCHNYSFKTFFWIWMIILWISFFQYLDLCLPVLCRKTPWSAVQLLVCPALSQQLFSLWSLPASAGDHRHDWPTSVWTKTTSGRFETYREHSQSEINFALTSAAGSALWKPTTEIFNTCSTETSTH